jgi:hypothetical protein
MVGPSDNDDGPPGSAMVKFLQELINYRTVKDKSLQPLMTNAHIHKECVCVCVCVCVCTCACAIVYANLPFTQ